MNFTKMTRIIRPISFARRDGDSLICAWHISIMYAQECTGYLPVPSADGVVSDMEIDPNCLLRLGACAPRRSSSGAIYKPKIRKIPPEAERGACVPRAIFQRDGSWDMAIDLNGKRTHGESFARRIMTPRQIEYPVGCHNCNDHRWVNLVQEQDCPGHGWKKSQFPASFLYRSLGDVILPDHSLWHREGPLEYPDCLFEE